MSTEDYIACSLCELYAHKECVQDQIKNLPFQCDKCQKFDKLDFVDPSQLVGNNIRNNDYKVNLKYLLFNLKS